MARYWVIGGEYADARFERIAGGGSEERVGPFEAHEAARAEWQRLAWQTVDSATTRYRIEEETETARYWVVGGAYKDAHFSEPVDGAEQWIGPFDLYAEAEWRRHAWATVDDALSRFRIEKLSAAAGPPPAC
ncbi:MAG: DUF4170 domain-containing protein [Dongiaceae bacterium]